MYDWKLPHVNSHPYLKRIDLLEDTIFIEAMDEPWKFCVEHKNGNQECFSKDTTVNTKKRTSIWNPSTLLNKIVWSAKKRLSMERRWHLHSIRLIMGAGRYLPQSWDH